MCIWDDALPEHLGGRVERSLPPYFQFIIPEGLILKTVEPEAGSYEQDEEEQRRL